MIKDYDRSHWFGASDAKYIFSDSQLSNSWRDWWDVKCGRNTTAFGGNVYTRAGNTFEHSILRTYDKRIRFDRQIRIPELRLRVNLDGNTDDEIYEVKTYQIDKAFKVTDAYFHQAQLQMLAWKMEKLINWVDCDGVPKQKSKNLPLKQHYILAYGLYPDEYYATYTDEQIEKGLIPIDRDRIKVYEVGRSRSFERSGKKVLKKLAKRLRKEEVNV